MLYRSSFSGELAILRSAIGVVGKRQQIRSSLNKRVTKVGRNIDVVDGLLHVIAFGYRHGRVKVKFDSLTSMIRGCLE